MTPLGAHDKPSKPLGFLFGSCSLLCLGLTGMIAYDATIAASLFLAFLMLCGLGGTGMLAYEAYAFFTVGNPTISAIAAYAFWRHGPIFVPAVLALGLTVGAVLGGHGTAAAASLAVALATGTLIGSLIAHVTGWRP